MLDQRDYQDVVDAGSEDDISSLAILLEELCFKIGPHDGMFAVEAHPAVFVVVERLYNLMSAIWKDDPYGTARDYCIAKSVDPNL